MAQVQGERMAPPAGTCAFWKTQGACVFLHFDLSCLWSLKHEHNRIPDVSTGWKRSLSCLLIQNCKSHGILQKPWGSKQAWNWNVNCSLCLAWNLPATQETWKTQGLIPGLGKSLGVGNGNSPVRRSGCPLGLTVWERGVLTQPSEIQYVRIVRWKQFNCCCSCGRKHWCLIAISSDHKAPHCPRLVYWWISKWDVRKQQKWNQRLCF